MSEMSTNLWPISPPPRMGPLSTYWSENRQPLQVIKSGIKRRKTVWTSHLMLCLLTFNYLVSCILSYYSDKNIFKFYNEKLIAWEYWEYKRK